MLLQIQFFIHRDTTTPYNAIQLGTDVMNITTTCKAEYNGLRIEKQGIEICTYFGGCGIHAANGLPQCILNFLFIFKSLYAGLIYFKVIEIICIGVYFSQTVSFCRFQGNVKKNNSISNTSISKRQHSKSIIFSSNQSKVFFDKQKNEKTSDQLKSLNSHLQG